MTAASTKDVRIDTISGKVAGTIQGSSFASITSAVWIGKPDTGSLPTRVFHTAA